MFNRHLAALLLAFFSALPSAWAFRCDGKIITEYTDRGEIRHFCGEPFSINRYVDYRIVAVQSDHRHHGHTEFITIPINVEEWVYNLGPNKLMRRLYFENGVLKDISTLGYGHK